MSGIHRDDRPALVALGLILAAIVFLAFFESGTSRLDGQPVNKQSGYGGAAQIQEYAEGDIASADTRPDDFNFWNDPFPQYAMAFFAFIATGTGVLGVFWLKQTLDATRDTAEAAESSNDLNKQIFYATNRPYIDIREVKLGQYEDDSGSFWWVSVEVENPTGSRAVDVSCDTKIEKRPLAIVGNSFTAEFARNSIKHSRAMGPVIVPINGSSVLFDRGADDLPKQGKLGGWMITVCVKYRSNVNPEFYYIAASYNVGGISQMFVDDTINGSREAEVTAALIADSQSAT